MTNASNISTNTSNIATNISDILTNASNISTNTSNIATNVSDISTNSGDIVTIQNDVNGFPDPLKNLTTGEVNQLENIGTATISATQWLYLHFLDQYLSTTASPTFNDVYSNGQITADTINETRHRCYC